MAGGDVGSGLRYLAASMAVDPSLRSAELYLSTVINQNCFEWDPALFEEILPVLPFYAQLLECLGRNREGQQQYREAERLYQRWAISHPNHAEPYARLGELYLFTNDHAAALAAFRTYRSITRESDYAVRRMALAASRLVRPRYDTMASDWFRKTRGQGRGSASIWETARWMDAAARDGEGRAQFNLGMLYSNGWGVPQDLNQALYWFQQAAGQDVADAQFELALAYLRGSGVPADVKLAYSFVQLAAGAGCPDAELLAGTMLDYGLGTEGDTQGAREYYASAERHFLDDQRDHQAQRAFHASQRLGMAYPDLAGLNAPINAADPR